MNRLLPIAVLVTAFLAPSCARQDPAPVITKEVNVAVPVPCVVDIKSQRPPLLTLPEFQKKIAEAPNTDTKIQLLVSQLLAHMGWLPVVEGALAGCEMAPKRNTP